MKYWKIVLTIWMSLLLGVSFAQGFQPGDKVADFTLADAAGKSHKLSDYTGKPAIVLIYVSTVCPVSNAYNERMAALYNDYSGKNVIFLKINSNKKETPSEIAQHAKSNGLKFPILKDENNVVADQYDATVTPEVYLLDGNLTLQYHGNIDDSQRPNQVKQNSLRNALDELLAGKPVSEKSTKAFGCSIKRNRK